MLPPTGFLSQASGNQLSSPTGVAVALGLGVGLGRGTLVGTAVGVGVGVGGTVAFTADRSRASCLNNVVEEKGLEVG